MRNGTDVAILAFGSMVAVANQIAEQLDATVANMRFIAPIDEELVNRLAQSHRCLITLEENTISGGAGSAVNECLARLGITQPVFNIGLPDGYNEQGERGELLAECGLDEDGVLRQIKQYLRSQIESFDDVGQRNLLASH